jgi:hypothetical protein
MIFNLPAASAVVAFTLLSVAPLLTDDAAEAALTDAKARQLMTEAAQARALWDDSFPGFTADIKINYEGQVQRGEVHVTPNGLVKLRQESEGRGPVFAWAKGWLGMLAFHRMGGQEEEDQYQGIRAVGNPNHPLGVMLALDDEFDSSFRVDGKVIRQVNRDLSPAQASGGLKRVRINVLTTRETPQGKILPLDFVINYLDDEQHLAMVETLSSEFVRLDGYDLPRWCRVITTRDGEMIAGVMQLSNHRLMIDNGEDL